MNEDFLHYVWRFQRFKSANLLTTDGEEVQVMRTGVHNGNAGPDFLDARIRIGNTVWAGNVEIHLQASDWFRHKHQYDAAYDNVILHVVYTADAEVDNGKGERIPCVCIKDLFDYHTWRQYKSWLQSDSFIPCEKSAAEVPEIIKSGTVHVAAIERIKEKSGLCLDHLNETNGDIEEAFYRLLLRAFGLKVNALPFEQLSRNTPYALLRKVWTDEHDLEALLLGQAGFLSNPELNEPYVNDLIARYAFLQQKHSLKPMPKSAWKLFRLRPPNFPQVRLAQLAAFYFRHKAVAQNILETENRDDFMKMFDVGLKDGFWLSHYTLDKESPPATKSIGGTTAQLILVNAVVPFLFALGRYHAREDISQNAVNLLEQLPAELNAVTRRFANIGFQVGSAFESQGLIQLKKFACDQKKCLNCKTGIYLLENYGKAVE